MSGMRLGAALWVERTTWPAVREAALSAERAGFDSLWIDDHLLCDEGAWGDPKFEGWMTLAALSAVTSRMSLGLLVGANTLRNPGLVAKMVATLDHTSGGRAVLGLGAGWFEREHHAFGFDFGATPGERLDRLEESVGLIRRLLDGQRVTHAGRFYRFEDAVCVPPPLQARLPILVGGSGRRKTLRIVARHADLWNAYGEPAEVADADATLREHCVTAGRDQAAIERTVTLNVTIRDSVEEAEAVFAETRSRHRPIEGEDRLDVGGPPPLVAARLREYAALGILHTIWVFRDPFDPETMARLGEVRALLGGRDV
jgi:F420-dependent oxidoreductase-like protein